MTDFDDGASFDCVVVGSGFGGSVAALRLVEKGYSVLVIEKGRRFSKESFPKTNWDVRNWMWEPGLGLRGFFQMSFFEHVTVLHGVGVGGGSLVYANTLAEPRDAFFEAPSWAGLAEWKRELAPHYATARRMLGVARNPLATRGDAVLRGIATDVGRPEHVHAADVGVYFGAPGVRAPDPYFNGEGPSRTGCTFCGACMTGCRVGAKNTLDRNYLYLAEKRGAVVAEETEVTHVRPRGAPSGEDGYVIRARTRHGDTRHVHARRVFFAGGVMGTVPLLLRMREDPGGLPRLSPRVGEAVRTNSEALIGVVAPGRRDAGAGASDEPFSKGVAITSIFHTDDHSHEEPVRYGAGSGFFRLLALPHAPAPTLLARLWGTAVGFAREPATWLRALTVRDFSRHSQVLLYMRTLEGTLSLRLGRRLRTGFRRRLVSRVDDAGAAPSAFMPEATDLARRFAEKVGGVTMTMLTETLLGVPSTAHVLGGACMGDRASRGVIDDRHRVFGYEGLYVVDGSAVSANPGVNPSLTITALAERALASVPAKGDEAVGAARRP